MRINPFNQSNKTIFTALLAVVLSACGGGDGGPSTGDTVTTTTPATTTVSGTVESAPIQGLEYTCNPSGDSGSTDANGTFTCQEGDTATFSIGDLVLGTSGTLTAGGVVTPAELAGDATNFNDAKAVRIAQLLQSLDSDGDYSNNIQIDADTIAALTSGGGIDATALQTALDGGTDFETTLLAAVRTAKDDPTATIVDAATSKSRLAATVTRVNNTQSRDVLGGEPITAAETANCPVGTAADSKVTIFTQQFPVCVINADITTDVTLTNDHVYVLDRAVKVGDGDLETGPTGSNNATLTVNPGTQIYGIDGLLTGLVITRGSKIEAEGTADLPIIMAAVTATGSGTSTVITDDPTNLNGRGQWAGLVLSGKGQSNLCTGSDGSGTLASEATPTGTQRFFGCDTDTDNSGTVKYVIIAESGLGFRPDQEVQGLTLEAVGSGTTINYLQVLGSEDDGIEWFGGAANASNIVINGQDDDGLDFDEGIRATVQKALVIMGSGNGDKGIEADNQGPEGVGFNSTPTSRVNFVNLTILGDSGGVTTSKGANFREGFGGRLIRSAMVDASANKQFGGGCLDFDDQVDEFTELRDFVADCANGTGTGGVSENTNATNFVTNGDNETGAGDAPADERDVTAFTGTINANTLALDSAGTPDNPGALPAAVNGVAIGDYIGAVDPASGNPDGDPNNNGAGGGPFWDGWTYINSGVDGGLPGNNFHPLEAEIRPATVVLVKGTLIDNAVNGVDYAGSGGSQSGVTGASGIDGEFTVEEGDTVTFSLGNLVLGTSLPISNGDIVTPAELAGSESNASNPKAIRIAQLLQSLDSDSNTSNGIQIAAAVITRLSTGGTVDADALQDALDSGTNWETVLGGVIDDLTAGNANRAENDIVSATAALNELSNAVNQDIGSAGSATSITPAATANCPAGIAATAKRDVFGKQFPVCVLNADITTSVTLTNDHIYVLDRAVKVGDGDLETGPTGTKNVTLSVSPGTQIYGIDGLLTGLVITRGSTINAVGTPDLPIIMAAVTATGSGASTVISDDPADLTGRGQWAGLVLSGRGENNLCTGSDGSGTLASEATPTGTQRFFGCDTNTDTSGTVEYVIIAESGLGFRADQEVQGLTLEGVGSGTRINFLQVLGSEDDGIEWFGGAANASNIVINGQDDDGLDFDEGIQATVQKALVIMGSGNGDKGIEADNQGPSGVGFNSTPTSRVNFVNLTILGDVGSEPTSKGANFREGFGGRLIRSAMVDASVSKQFGGGCLDFDDQVDEFTELRDFVALCANGSDAGVAGSGVSENTNATNFVMSGDNETGMGDAPADERDVTAFTGTINANTLALDSAGTPDNPGALPAAVNGVAIGDYIGAVDPASGNPDGDPNNNGAGGGPFWDGWTYIHPSVDGGLPGATFHPLQEEIQ